MLRLDMVILKDDMETGGINKFDSERIIMRVLRISRNEEDDEKIWQRL